MYYPTDTTAHSTAFVKPELDGTRNSFMGPSRMAGGRGFGARCSSVVRTLVHGAMGRQIDPSW